MSNVETFEGAVQKAFVMAREMNLPTFQLRWKGKPFGLVHFVKGKYYVHRDPSRHFFRKWQSYGVSKAILAELKSYRVSTVVLFEHGKTGNKRFGINVERFFNHQPLLERINELEPYESQLHIPLSEWTVETGRLPTL